MVSMRSEKFIMHLLHPVYQMFPQRCLWNSSNVRLIDDVPSLVPFKEDRLTFHFECLFPPGDRWCDVLAFAPACSVSNFSTLQIFRRDTSQLWGLLCPPVCLLGHFPSPRHVQGSIHTHTHFSTINTFQPGLPFPVFTFCSRLIESVRTMGMCGLTVSSWGSSVPDVLEVL